MLSRLSALFLLILFSPIFILVSFAILIEDGFPVFFSQKRIAKTSLDELPNLINIIKGEMVFVGPRPALFNQDDLMELRVATGVSKLKPGITGWAQVNGRDEISIPDKVRLEQEYMSRKSILFDIEIIFKTFTSVLRSKGVKH
jgi:O-antigen biosynthesis protein WbqP